MASTNSLRLENVVSLAGRPELIEWEHEINPPNLITVVIDGVEWICWVTGRKIKSKITITYNPSYRIVEFFSLRKWVRGFASARKWIAEELVSAMAYALSNILKTCVRVEMEYREDVDMSVSIEREACP